MVQTETIPLRIILTLCSLILFLSYTPCKSWGWNQIFTFSFFIYKHQNGAVEKSILCWLALLKILITNLKLTLLLAWWPYYCFLDCPLWHSLRIFIYFMLSPFLILKSIKRSLPLDCKSLRSAPYLKTSLWPYSTSHSSYKEKGTLTQFMLWEVKGQGATFSKHGVSSKTVFEK